MTKHKLLWRAGTSLIALQVAFLTLTPSSVNAMQIKKLYMDSGKTEDEAEAMVSRGKSMTPQATVEFGKKAAAVKKEAGSMTIEEAIKVTDAALKGGATFYGLLDEKDPSFKKTVKSAEILVKSGYVSTITKDTIDAVHEFGPGELELMKRAPKVNLGDKDTIEAVKVIVKKGWDTKANPITAEDIQAYAALQAKTGPVSGLAKKKGDPTEDETRAYGALIRLKRTAKLKPEEFELATILLGKTNDEKEVITGKNLDADDIDGALALLGKEDKNGKKIKLDSFAQDHLDLLFSVIGLKALNGKTITPNNLTQDHLEAIYTVLGKETKDGDEITLEEMSQEDFNLAEALLGKDKADGTTIDKDELTEDEFIMAQALLGKNNKKAAKITPATLTQEDLDVVFALMGKQNADGAAILSTNLKQEDIDTAYSLLGTKRTDKTEITAGNLTQGELDAAYGKKGLGKAGKTKLTPLEEKVFSKLTDDKMKDSNGKTFDFLNPSEEDVKLAVKLASGMKDEKGTEITPDSLTQDHLNIAFDLCKGKKKNASGDEITAKNMTQEDLNVGLALAQLTHATVQDNLNAAYAVLGKKKFDGKTDITVDTIDEKDLTIAAMLFGKKNPDGKTITVKTLDQNDLYMGYMIESFTTDLSKVTQDMLDAPNLLLGKKKADGTVMTAAKDLTFNEVKAATILMGRKNKAGDVITAKNLGQGDLDLIYKMDKLGLLTSKEIQLEMDTFNAVLEKNYGTANKMNVSTVTRDAFDAAYTLIKDGGKEDKDGKKIQPANLTQEHLDIVEAIVNASSIPAQKITQANLNHAFALLGKDYGKTKGITAATLDGTALEAARILFGKRNGKGDEITAKNIAQIDLDIFYELGTTFSVKNINQDFLDAAYAIIGKDDGTGKTTAITVKTMTAAQLNAALGLLGKKDVTGDVITPTNITEDQLGLGTALLGKIGADGKTKIGATTLSQEDLDNALGLIGKTGADGVTAIDATNLSQDDLNAAFALTGKKDAAGNVIEAGTFTQAQLDVVYKLMATGTGAHAITQADLDKTLSTVAIFGATPPTKAQEAALKELNDASITPGNVAQIDLYAAAPDKPMTPFAKAGFGTDPITKGDVVAALQAFNNEGGIADASAAELTLWINPQDATSLGLYKAAAGGTNTFELPQGIYDGKAKAGNVSKGQLATCRKNLLADRVAGRKF